MLNLQGLLSVCVNFLKDMTLLPSIDDLPPKEIPTPGLDPWRQWHLFEEILLQKTQHVLNHSYRRGDSTFSYSFHITHGEKKKSSPEINDCVIKLNNVFMLSKQTVYICIKLFTCQYTCNFIPFLFLWFLCTLVSLDCYFLNVFCLTADAWRWLSQYHIFSCGFTCFMYWLFHEPAHVTFVFKLKLHVIFPIFCIWSLMFCWK